MTPDELRALPPAERLPHLRSLYLAFLDWPEDDPAPNFEGRASVALLAIDAADELARDHADLREWAERAAESLRDPWETVWNVDEAEPERGEQPTIRQKDTSSLLAEYAERWGDT